MAAPALLPAPDAIRVSLLIHAAWMLAGAYRLARAALGVGRLPALIAAALFAFGGYMGGRVEQINQYQGLAWLPWVFWLAHMLPDHPRRYAPVLAMCWALQVFTGHTQTVFITAVGVGLCALLSPGRGRRLLWLALSGAGALVLALPQLIPTAELTAVSNRGRGLNPNEATAFSFNPFLAARGLLPAYDRPLFAEYIAYPGVIALGLALVGLAARQRTALIWGTLALIGLLFAFGQYNPLYWQMAGLPGFNLFRVPARWLVLFALGTAMLAGLGLDALLRGQRMTWRLPALLFVVIGGLALAAFAAAVAAAAAMVAGWRCRADGAQPGASAVLAADAGDGGRLGRGADRVRCDVRAAADAPSCLRAGCGGPDRAAAGSRRAALQSSDSARYL